MPTRTGHTSRVEVTPADLRSLAAMWRSQEWDLRSAGDGLASVPAGASVSVGLPGFLDAWATEIRSLAAAAGSLADGLEATAREFTEVDRAVVDR